MGYCQGRVCGPVLQQAVATAAGRSLTEVGDLQSRPVVTPVTLAAIAASGVSSGSGGPTRSGGPGVSSGQSVGR